MFRFLTIALLAGAAIPAAAIAQDNDAPRAERGDRGPRAERGPRPDRPAFQPGQRPERAPRVERQQRSFTPQAEQPQVAAQPQARPDRGNWRENRGGDGRRGWRGEAPAVAAPPAPTPQVGAGNQRREWNRDGNSAGRDWNRDANRRDWNRNNAAQRDWNRNDARRGGNWNDNRRVDDNRRWDGNRNARNWNRDWRNDRRYDWQGYRSSNRYAYRLPRYYAPSGWNYGYRRFGVGTYLFAGLFAQNYWIGDPYDYRLPPVDWPYRWVRYYDDALLVDTTTGEVVDVIPGIFW